MSFTVIIPARYAASRLPGKPLLEISGKPLLQHVYERALESDATRIIIATDDKKIEQAALSFGAQVCMTRSDHPSGTDRLAEVVDALELDEEEIIVNLQGDEPMMPGKLLGRVAEALISDQTAAISTLCEAIVDMDEIFDPNIVKVVFDQAGYALYFSRAPIPWDRAQFNPQTTSAISSVTASVYYRHIGLYAYRASFLRTYPLMKTCALEQIECLEQLRAMYYGYRIRVIKALEPTGAGVDTLEDLQKIRLLMADKK